MRISELSARSGVPIPRIKYYIREGLVARASTTEDTPGGYGEDHLHRVRLIRAMVTIGGMSIAAARAVLAELDSPTPQVPEALGQAMLGIDDRPEEGETENRARASAIVDDLIAERRWNLAEDEPARDALLTAVETMIETGHAEMLGHLEVYAEAADRIADADMASLAAADSPAAIVEKSVVGTVLGEIFIDSMRRLAHSDRARRRYWPGEGDAD